jgi:hypothetical protein
MKLAYRWTVDLHTLKKSGRELRLTGLVFGPLMFGLVYPAFRLRRARRERK